MQSHIASFLFQHKSCPLPGIGTLYMRRTGAVGDFTSKRIAAPGAGIQFDHTDTDPGSLLEYIAAATGGNKYEVTAGLDHFCDKLKKGLDAQQQVDLRGIGIFYADSTGRISFTEATLPAAFLQPVFAERVIHPNDEHAILVGDKESTNTLMTEMLLPKTETRNNWWIWAIVLALVAVTIILLYFSISNNASSLGNAVKI